jgi:hypothetical protein
MQYETKKHIRDEDDVDYYDIQTHGIHNRLLIADQVREKELKLEAKHKRENELRMIEMGKSNK